MLKINYWDMKKVYLIMSAAMLCGVSYGQYAQPRGGLSPFAKLASAAEVERPEVRHDASNSFDRGAAIWSEDFANGLSSTNGTWTVGGVNGNLWKHAFLPSSGCWSAGNPASGFTTANNGYMMYDTDSANCIGGTASSNVFEGELISPSIDLSSEPAVDVVFEQHFRYCCSGPDFELMLGVSNDGGSTWTEYSVIGGVDVNDGSANPDVVQINISAVAANQANVQIRFRWGGVSHYYWSVDDINLVPSPPHEVAVIESGIRSISFAGSNQVPYTMVPDQQAQDFYFFGRVTNQGATTESVTFEAEVFDGASSVFTSSGYQGATSIAPGIELYDTTDAVWNSGTSVGTNYEFDLFFDYANIGSDAITDNNRDSGNIMVTEDVYARDANTYTGSGLWNGETGGISDPFVMGPVYNMAAQDTIWFVECALTGSTDPGVVIFAQIYQIDQATGSFDIVYDGAGTVNGGEFSVENYHISSAASGIVTVKVPVENGLIMMPNEEYIVTIGHYGGSDALVLMNGRSATPEQTVFVLDGTDNTWYYMTSTPLIRAQFDPVGLGIEDNSINAELGQNVPNPFNETSQINYTLETAANVSLEITDVAGKVVMRSNEGVKGAGQYNITLNASDFAQGVYYYTLTVGENAITKKMVVNK